MNIRIAITNAMQRAAICAPIAALRTTGKALSRFTPPHYSTPVNPNPSHGNIGVLHGGSRMKHRTAANTRAPRNVGVLLALLVIAFTYCWIPMASAQLQFTDETIETIPDPELRRRVYNKLYDNLTWRNREMLPLRKTISATDLRDYLPTTLDFSNAWDAPSDAPRIKDLTGLEHATNVVTLYLSYHAISDLSPIADLRKLKTLWVNDNNISDLSPIANPPIANPSDRREMTWLDAQFNNISDVPPMEGLPALVTLTLSNNPLGDNIRGIQSLSELKRLHLNRIGLRDLSPVAGLTNLNQLNAADNQITDISPLRGLTNLQRLNLHENEIRDISPLEGLIKLQTVRLEANEIRDISPIAGWTHIRDDIFA